MYIHIHAYKYIYSSSFYLWQLAHDLHGMHATRHDGVGLVLFVLLVAFYLWQAICGVLFVAASA